MNPLSEKTEGPPRRISARDRNAFVFLSAILLLSLCALVTYHAIFRLIDAQQRVTHSREVQSALSNIAAVISRAGGRRVEYVHTGDPDRLQEYKAAVSELLRAVERVRTITADNPAQQSYCTQLESLVSKRIDLMNRSIELRESGHFDLQQEAELAQQIVHVAAQIDSLILQMQRLEEQVLTERQLHSQALFRQQTLLLSLAFGLAVMLLALHYYVLNQELNARQRAEVSLRRLSVRLLETQDGERRRVSRELHESIGQYLSGAKMSLEVLRKSMPQNQVLSDAIIIIDKSIAETRNISELLHPPLLDEIGFASAATWYAEDFLERSGMKVQLNLPKQLGRLPSEIELALFRVLQESLASLHEHSPKARVLVDVELHPNQVKLRVMNFGRNVANASEQFGLYENDSNDPVVGLAGIRERVRELGGSVKIESSDAGSLIEAILPVTNPVQAESSSIGSWQ